MFKNVFLNKLILVSLTFVFVGFFGEVTRAEELSFFGGAVRANLTWMTPPLVSKVARLKIELFDDSKHIYDIDPSLISVGLFMAGMATDFQDVVALNDAHNMGFETLGLLRLAIESFCYLILRSLL